MRLRAENELGEIYHLGEVGQPKGVTVVFGGQAGSEGKGAIAGWLARRYEWAIAAGTLMPNAGHTFVDGDRTIVTRSLPMALVSDSVRSLYIGASAVIDPDVFQDELEELDGDYDVARRLVIHPRAQVMRQEYVEWEAENLKHIASTGKGCGAALAAKVRREQTTTLAEDHEILRDFVRQDADMWINETVNTGSGILVEQSQGFDLDIHHGVSYPFCTSRQCTPSQICADLGLEARLITNSIAVLRTYPIRVGNADGYSGDYGSDEVSWPAVSIPAGREVVERTTVTGRVRRVFEFDFERIKHMSLVARPTSVALTFADYIDGDLFEMTDERFADEHKRGLVRASETLMRFIYQVEKAVARPSCAKIPVKLVKTGPDNDHILNLGFMP